MIYLSYIFLPYVMTWKKAKFMCVVCTDNLDDRERQPDSTPVHKYYITGLQKAFYVTLI